MISFGQFLAERFVNAIDNLKMFKKKTTAKQALQLIVDQYMENQ